MTLFLGATVQSQTISGLIGDFNIWDHEMDATQIYGMPCGATGNIVEWSRLIEQGSSTAVTESYPEC